MLSHFVTRQVDSTKSQKGRENIPVRGPAELGAELGSRSAQGAATHVYCSLGELGEGRGEFWADVNVAKASRGGVDDGLARRLWAKSEELVAPFV